VSFQKFLVRRCFASALALTCLFGSLVLTEVPSQADSNTSCNADVCSRSFEFTGQVVTWMPPSYVRFVSIEITGGTGGTGASDSHGNGGTVSEAIQVLVPQFAVDSNSIIQIGVGSGGGSTSGSWNPTPGDGGINPYSQFSGGRGGYPIPSSGAGGGGGAASVVTISDQTFLAAGTGGAGGGSWYRPGGNGKSNHSPRSEGFSSGENGFSPVSDGGGGGGGGGGLTGGAAGQGGRDNLAFSTGGYAGSSSLGSQGIASVVQSSPSAGGRVKISWMAVRPPSDVSVVQCTSVDSSAVCYFISPSASGGAEITNYEYSIDDGLTWAAASPAQTTSPIVISGLVNGTTYAVRLRAVNEAGAGVSSNAVSVKPIAPASAPSISGVTAGNGQATLSISAPAQINDSSLSGYDYSINNGSTWSHFASATGPFTITGLTNATAYQVKVRAVNSAGVGEASSALTINPTKLLPTKPVIASVVGGNGSATVSITTPTDVTAQSVTGYQYSINKGATYQNAVVSNGSFSITGLTNGVSTSVQIRATNFNGNSLASLAKSVVPATSPAAPSITTITPSAGALSIAFTAGATGGSAVTGYQYSLDGGSTWLAPKTAVKTSPLKVTGLPNATAYQVKIRAVNVIGAGLASDAVSASTPVLVPSAPTTIGISKTSTTFTVDVTAPVNNGGGAITNYAYSVDSGKTWTEVSPASNSTRIVISGLKSNTTYPVQIAAVNSAGRGAGSSKYSAQTLR